VAPKWLVLEQQVQSDTAPSFDIAWQVMTTAALR
jgi:hypothetical protein